MPPTVASLLLGRPSQRALRTPDEVAQPSGPPGRGVQAGELATAWQLARLARAAPWLATAPRGDGHHVIDLPGWRAPEVSLAPLRAYLRALGYRAEGWGLGSNIDDPERSAMRLLERLASDGRAEPVTLVGWSLGGVVAREIARNEPDRVRRVITFGTPVIGGPTHTVAAGLAGEEECRRVDALARRLDAERPIEVPITAMVTRRDGVVHWRACVDHVSPRVEHVEVGSTHLGLGIDPDVWWTIAQTLAQDARSASGRR